MQALLTDAPVLLDYLDDASKQHFDRWCEQLTAAGVHYTVNPRLVRGLDYYNRSVFEWVTDSLGAQGTVCAGGRYDGLVAQLGGRATPAVGFALGIERLVLLLETLSSLPSEVAVADIYVGALGDETLTYAISVAEHLRNALPEHRVMLHCGGGNMKKQVKRADKIGAALMVMVGTDEMSRSVVSIKPLRIETEQFEVPLTDVTSALVNQFIR